MRKIRNLLILIIIIITVFVGTGYATATLNSSQTEFKVRFSGKPIVSNEDKVKASITNDINATVNVTDLTMKENIETVTYVIQNTSKDLSAEVSLNVSNNNKDYFLIESEVEKTILKKGEATKVIVKIELIKEPVEEREKATIGIQLDAKPIQPIEDDKPKQEPNNSSSSSSSSSSSTTNPSTPNKDYGYYEKDETPKTGVFRIIDIFWR